MLPEADSYSSSGIDLFCATFLWFWIFSIAEFQQEKQSLSERKRDGLCILYIPRYFETAASAHFWKLFFLKR